MLIHLIVQNWVSKPSLARLEQCEIYHHSYVHRRLLRTEGQTWFTSTWGEAIMHYQEMYRDDARASCVGRDKDEETMLWGSILGRQWKIIVGHLRLSAEDARGDGETDDNFGMLRTTWGDIVWLRGEDGWVREGKETHLEGVIVPVGVLLATGAAGFGDFFSERH